MIITLCSMGISNYKVWKTLFDNYANGRRAIGSLGGSIYKKNNGRSIMVLMRWEDKKRALAFHESSSLAKAMNQAGVISTPLVVFYDEEEIVEV